MNYKKSQYYVPDLSTKDIISYFSELNISISAADILKPSIAVTTAIFDSILEILEGKGIDDCEESLQVIKQVQRMGNLLSKIGITNFTIRDLNPDSRRLIQILSAIVNFSMFRDNKKYLYEQASKITEMNYLTKNQLEKKKAEIKQDIVHVEQAIEENCKIKEKLESEIISLENELKEFYKYQKEKMGEVSLLKNEKIQIGDKLCSCQLLEHNLKQEITVLKSQIISDPSKLLELIEEMRLLIDKEKEEISIFEKKINEINSNINKQNKTKEHLAGILNVLTELNKVEEEIEKYEQGIITSESKIKNWDSNINAIKIRINHIERQISHLENRIYNLQNRDKKISEETSAKIADLQQKYNAVNLEREDLLEKVRLNNKLTQDIMFEKAQRSGEHERECAEIASALVNLNGDIDRYFNEIKNAINIGFSNIF